MSEDRLGEIKHYITTIYQGHMARGHFDWLLSEVERLRAEAKERHLSNQALIKKFDEQDATIATLTERIKELETILAESKKD